MMPIVRLATLLMLAFIPFSAFSHAVLQSASPQADAVMTQSPHEIRLRFNEPLEHDFSSVQVTSSNGTTVEATGHKINVSEAELAEELPGLPPGVYQVSWSALAKDGHRTKGTYRFTVVR